MNILELLLNTSALERLQKNWKNGQMKLRRSEVNCVKKGPVGKKGFINGLTHRNKPRIDRFSYTKALRKGER